MNDDIDDRPTLTDLFEPMHDAPAPEPDEDALNSLPDEEYEAFVRYELCGQSCRRISALLGIPTATVASRLESARRRLGQGSPNLYPA